MISFRLSFSPNIKYARITQTTGERLFTTPMIAIGITLVAAKLIKLTIVPCTDLNARGNTSPFYTSSIKIFFALTLIKHIIINVAQVDLRTSIISADTVD